MLRWTDNLTPIDPRFDDKYFAEEGGLDESRYVFIGQNDIEKRIQESDRLCIGELGFGTGLNFFATWQVWQRLRRPGAWLHYLACEINPLSREDIQKTTSVWPELEPLVEIFLKSYKPFFPGFHRIVLPNERISLTLLIGDAKTSLDALEFRDARVDAWYLDGFAPRKNPEMWSAEIFKRVFELSNEGATFATFTAAGWVKRNLMAAGFDVEKFDGFGRKREMLKGRKASSATSAFRASPSYDITIVGAGLAGCFAAHSLALRGHRIRLIDKHTHVAAEASGNPAALMMPVLTALPSWASRFSLQALRLLVDQLERLDLLKDNQRGILQILRTEKEVDRIRRALEWLKLPSEFAKLIDHESKPALFFPWATTASPKRICEALIERNSQIQFQGGVDFKSAEELKWKSDIVVFANAQGIHEFEDLKFLPLKPVRGQICWADAKGIDLPLTLSGDKTITKSEDGYLVVGSTYDRENLDRQVRESENLEMLASIEDNYGVEIPPESLRGSRAEWRSATLERIPIVGELGENRFCSVGLGSRGFLFAPLGAEILSHLIDGGPSPVEADLLQALSPTRFRISSSASISDRQ